MDVQIVSISDRPDLAQVVAAWLLDGFGHAASPTLQVMTEKILAPPNGPEDSFVLLEDGRPVGTASLAHDDLPTRRDLTPWLAGVFVELASRGRGYASALVRHVEAFAHAAAVPTLWLYTWTAEPLYARLGWERAGLQYHRDHEVVLMRRALDTDLA